VRSQFQSNTIHKLPLTLNLLTTTIVAPSSNASKWRMGFNLAFKGLKTDHIRMEHRLKEFSDFKLFYNH